MSETTLSPGKRRLKKQVQKHRRKVSETQTENAAPLARLLPAASTSTEAILASSYAQTSPMPSPRLSAARRRSHRHYHSRPKFDEDLVSEAGASTLSSGGGGAGGISASNSLRLTSGQPKASPTKHGSLSKQLSLEGEAFKKQVISTRASQQPPPHLAASSNGKFFFKSQIIICDFDHI